tara:strand:- start:1728 stop:2789 length:1062 start_codon:yes stop_codon:yes gene_type:complete
MAIQSFGTTHKLTEHQWCEELFYEYIPNSYFFQYMGGDASSPVVVKSDLEAKPGDKLTIPKLYLLDPDSGVEGDITLEGKEQDMAYGADEMTALQIRNAVRILGGLSAQRTARKTRDDAKSVLMTWKEQELDNRIFKVLTANPTANRILACDSTVTSDVSIPVAGIDDIATTDVLTVEAIRSIKLFAITGNDGNAEKIHPYRTVDRHGKDLYLFFCDYYAIRDLKRDPLFVEYSKEYASAREDFFRGGIANVDGVIIIECDKIEREQNATSVMVAKNLFLGASAVAVTWAGKDKNGNKQGAHTQWYERDDFDYGNQCGIAVGDIKGVKKIAFDNEGVAQDDNGVIVFYSASIA